MINLSLDKLRLIAQHRSIRDYENKSKKDLIKSLSKPKPKIKINEKKLEEIRKDFNKLRHTFSKKEIDKYRKAFYDIKNYRCLSASEIKAPRKILNKFKKAWSLKRIHGDVDSLDYDDLDDYDDDFANDDEYRRIRSNRRLFKSDYCKPIRIDAGFAGRRNNYIGYTSRGDRYRNYRKKNILIWLDHI